MNQLPVLSGLRRTRMTNMEGQGNVRYGRAPEGGLDGQLRAWR